MSPRCFWAWHSSGKGYMTEGLLAVSLCVTVGPRTRWLASLRESTLTYRWLLFIDITYNHLPYGYTVVFIVNLNRLLLQRCFYWWILPCHGRILHIIIGLVAAKCNIVLMMDLNISLQDFTEMIVHHMATLLLMYLSWMVNFTRVGTLVLLVHDCVDPIMEVSGAHPVSGQFPPLPMLSLDSSHPYPLSHWTVPTLTHSHWTVPTLTRSFTGQFPPLPALSLDSSHPYPHSHWTVPTLTRALTGQFPPLPTLSLDSSHPYPLSHWTVPTLTRSLTGQFPPLPALSLDSSHPYPRSHWTVPTLTRALTGQFPPLPGQKWWSVFNWRQIVQCARRL